MVIYWSEESTKTMPDNIHGKKRKVSVKFKTLYLSVTSAEAEMRLGFRLQLLRGRPVHKKLAGAETMFGKDTVRETKEKGYNRILEHLTVEGYPTEADSDLKQVNVDHLVYTIIVPVLNDFIRRTGRKDIQLKCEKEIISTDSETGGEEEFVVVDMISVSQENFIFVVESKRSSVGKAMRQCLLAMKDMRDNNGDGKVYGFVTTGENWQMLEYDGTSFRMSESIAVIFGSMDEDKQRWLDSSSCLVGCVYFALSNGGIVKEMVVQVLF